MIKFGNQKEPGQNESFEIILNSKSGNIRNYNQTTDLSVSGHHATINSIFNNKQNRQVQIRPKTGGAGNRSMISKGIQNNIANTINIDSNALIQNAKPMQGRAMSGIHPRVSNQQKVSNFPNSLKGTNKPLDATTTFSTKTVSHQNNTNAKHSKNTSALKYNHFQVKQILKSGQELPTGQKERNIHACS